MFIIQAKSSDKTTVYVNGDAIAWIEEAPLSGGKASSVRMLASGKAMYVEIAEAPDALAKRLNAEEQRRRGGAGSGRVTG